MNKVLISILALFFTTSQHQTTIINGTWVNSKIIDAVQKGELSANLEQIVPRCIYIEKSSKITIEYRFEQRSKTTSFTPISNRGDSIFFQALGRDFVVVNDSTLLIDNHGQNMIFKKINNRPVVGSGIQALLKSFFWSANEKWTVIKFKNGGTSDTVIGKVQKSKINLGANNLAFEDYEFTDLKRYSVNGKKLFGIGIFELGNSNMTERNEVFAIEKSAAFVYLYKEGKLLYKLSPAK